MTNDQAVEHPSVWKGKELINQQDWLHELRPAETQQILDADKSERPIEDFAPEFHQMLLSIQNSLEHGSGAAMIRGLDISELEVDQTERLFLRISSIIGTPLSQSAKGEKIFSVRNAGFADDDPRARGPNTRKKLSFHTDRCDVIGFLCVQQAKTGGENQLVSSAAIYNEILSRRPDLLEVLMQPFCYQRHTVDTGNDLPYTKQPIFSFFQGHFAANFLRVLIERAHQDASLPDLSTTQIEALDLVESIAAEPEMHVTFTQQPGDILFLNNWVTFHRRTSFDDHAELERRRHILRVWLSMPNSRPLDPLFAGNYGATAAGAIRGGMKAALEKSN